MEHWELNRIDRLENRVEKLEWKNRERSDFWLRMWTYVLMAAAWILAFAVIATHASNS